VSVELLPQIERLRGDLTEMVEMASTGRPAELNEASCRLEIALARFEDFCRGLAESPPHSLADPLALRKELKSCRSLTRRLGALIQQAQEIRLVHWRPAPGVSGYTACGAAEEWRLGPKLVRQSG
jgi:hypothetical protein